MKLTPSYKPDAALLQKLLEFSESVWLTSGVHPDAMVSALIFSAVLLRAPTMRVGVRSLKKKLKSNGVLCTRESRRLFYSYLPP